MRDRRENAKIYTYIHTPLTPLSGLNARNTPLDLVELIPLLCLLTCINNEGYNVQFEAKGIKKIHQVTV